MDISMYIHCTTLQAVTRAPMPSPPSRHAAIHVPSDQTRPSWTPLPPVSCTCFLGPAFSPLRVAIEPHSPRGTVVNGHRSRSPAAVNEGFTDRERHHRRRRRRPVAMDQNAIDSSWSWILQSSGRHPAESSMDSSAESSACLYYTLSGLQSACRAPICARRP